MNEALDKKEGEYFYRGLKIRTARGVHEFTFSRIKELSQANGAEAPGKRVLDLGCGSGALSQRLIDSGFRATCCDLGGDFLASGDFMRADLNGDFASALSADKYDFIVALEVIEHLENPLHFLRQLRKLASPWTRVFISFPNIHMWQAVRTFLRDGTFVNWNVWQYRNTRHCTIMTDWLMEEHLARTGFRVERKYFPARLELPRTWKYPAHLFFYSAVSLFSGGKTRGARRSDTVLFEISPVNEG